MLNPCIFEQGGRGRVGGGERGGSREKYPNYAAKNIFSQTLFALFAFHI